MARQRQPGPPGGGREDMRKRMTSAVWVKGIAEMLAAEGLDLRGLLAAPEIPLLAVELAYPAPADPVPYRDAFGCVPRFDATGNSLLFSLAELRQPLRTSNPVLAELHERYAGEYLRRFDDTLTSYRVRELIMRRLPAGEPRRDEIAIALHTSERTLQRRLEDEETSFVQLLDD